MIRLKSLLFEQKTTDKPNVLFVGDSQTASNVSFARRLLNNDIVTGKVAAKVGASMKKISNLFASAFEPNKFDIVCLLGGNNDAGNNKIDTDSFEKIIKTAKRGGSKVILITSPTMEFINKKMYPNDYPLANKIPQWQLSLAQENNIPVINSYELFDDPKYFSADGLHLNAGAHKLLANNFTEVASGLVDMPMSNEKESDTKTDKLTTDKRDIINLGDTGSKVKLIQGLLIKLGYSVGKRKDDGVFGNKTELGVRTFQKMNHIPITGVVDDSTYKLLTSDSAKKNKKINNKLTEPTPEQPATNQIATDDTKSNSTKLSNIAKAALTPITTAVADVNLNPSQTATANTVVDFFVNKGLTKEQAIGIAANLQAESGFKTGILGDSGTSIGLAQWHADRMNNLMSWTKENNLDPMSVEGQLEYLWHELNTTHKRAMSSIRSATTAGDAAYAFTVDFEVPANKRVKGQERASIANGLVDKLS